MSRIAQVETFPFSLVQKPGFCVPANIEAVTTYLNPQGRVSQEYIAEKYVHKGGTILTISLPSLKALVLDSDPAFKPYRSEFIGPESVHSFDAFAERVKRSIDNNLPHIISVPVFVLNRHSGWHMLTAVGYNDQTLEVYNSEPTLNFPSRFHFGLDQLRNSLSAAQVSTDVTHSLVLSRLS